MIASLPTSFEVTSRQYGPSVVVYLAGMAHFRCVRQLEAELNRVASQRPVAVVFDVGNLHFLSANATRLLVECASEVRRHGGTVRVVGGNQQSDIREMVFDGELQPGDDTRWYAAATLLELRAALDELS